jgi:hypothetical protein
MGINFEAAVPNETACARMVEAMGADRLACPAIPEDLREWLSEPELVLWVEEAVHKCTKVEIPQLAHERELLLRIIAYSYSTGTYLSEEIEAAFLISGKEPVLENPIQSLSGTIRQFRRYHRELVEACLFGVLSAASRAPRAGKGIPSSTLMSEASRRVLQAIRYDSWSLDF